MAVHLPVMVREVVEALRPHSGGVYVDATVGLGGHAEKLLSHIRRGRLVCIDRDAEALELAAQRLGDERCVFRKARFSNMREVLGELGIRSVDGVLMDLGVSMYQLKFPGRGFGFQSDDSLDMRMDRSGGLTAAEIVNTWPKEKIEKVLWEYAEERHSRRIAGAILRARQASPIRTCRELAGVVAGVLPRRGRLHPATRTFQALRIAVNDELGEIERGLEAALSSLAAGGRLAVISYHSLEDRAVKNFVRAGEREGKLRSLYKKPLVPEREEIMRNPSSRSAKLRAAEAI